MLIDARTLPADAELSFDICVVGSGPAGITLATELDGSGARVCLLERGGATPTSRTRSITSGENADRAYYRLEQTRVAAYAGSANHWMDTSGMRARPLDDLDFRPRPSIGREGWPISPDDLTAPYRRAQAICGLGSEDYALPTWTTPDAPELVLGEEFETVMFQLAPLGAFQATRPQMAVSPDTTVLLHATALELLTDATGQRVDSIRIGVAPGRSARIRARHVVLAGGGLENPRLLLLSRGRHARGIGNDHDVVGRGFMEHPHVRSGVIHSAGPDLFRQLGLYRWEGPGHIARIGMIKLRDEVLEREGLPAAAFYLHATAPELVSPAARALVDLRDLRTYRRPTPATGRRLATVARRPAEATRAVLRSRRDPDVPVRTVQMLAMTEQLPDNGSRVTLGEGVDEFGSPRVCLEWRVTQADHRAIRVPQERLDAALRATGLGHVDHLLGDEDPPATIGGGFHHMGTTRMGGDPATSVVDAHGKVHGMANLHITGTSVFPTAGYANPTLTVVALAVRLAARLRAAMGS